MQQSMDEQDRVVCPPTKELIEPVKVWESKDPVTKKTNRYGTMRQHQHDKQDCEYSGHTGPVERLPKPEVTPVHTPPDDDYGWCGVLENREQPLVDNLFEAYISMLLFGPTGFRID